MDEKLEKIEQETKEYGKLEIVTDIVKFGIGLVVGSGISVLCSKATGSLIGNDENLKRTEKLAAGIAGTVVGGMISEKADDYISRQVDKVVDTAKSFIGFFKELKEVEKKGA